MSLLNSLLVSRIALVKPEKAVSVQNYLIQLAQRGSIRDRVDEPTLISLLSTSCPTSTPESSSITFIKRPSHEEDLDLSQFLK